MTSDKSSIPGPETILRREYPNGMTVLVKENFSNPSVVINGLMRFGGMDVKKREQSGLALFMTDMMMRGTQRRNFQQIYEEIESVGATLNINAGLNASGFGSRSLAEDLPLMLDILSDVIQHPTFPENEVEKVRGEFQTSLEERTNSTGRMASLTFRELLYPQGHPYAISGLGYPETINALTRDDFKTFYREHVGAQGMIAVIVGAVKAEDAFQMWEDALGGWTGAVRDRDPLPHAPQLSEVRHKSVEVPGKSQSDLILGFVGPRRADPDYNAAMLCNTVLGVFGMYGRLGTKVRIQGGMAYYAYSSVEGGMGQGAWNAIAGVNPANVDRAVELIRTEIKRICDKKVPARELADSKSFRTGSLPLQLETSGGVAANVLNMELYDLGMDYLQKYTDTINAITPKQVQEVARNYLDPDVYALAVAGPAQT